MGHIKLSRFSAYYTNAVIPEVKAQPGYDTGNWAEFETSLQKYYFDRDAQQIEYQMPFLRTLAERQRAKGTAAKGTENIKAYCLQYKRIARALIGQGKISQYSACAEFFVGLPEKVQDEVQKNLGISFTQSNRLDINRVIQEVINIEDRKLERKRILHYVAGPTSITNFPAGPINISSLPVAIALHTVRNGPKPKDPTRDLGYMPLPVSAQHVTVSTPTDNLSTLIGRLNLSLADMVNTLKQHPPQQPR